MFFDIHHFFVKHFYSFVPMKEKRRALKGQLEAYKIATIMDGDKERKPSFKELRGFNVIKTGHGQNNRLILHTPLNKNHITILMAGDNNTLNLGGGFQGQMKVWFNEDNGSLSIGEDCIFSDVEFFPSSFKMEVGKGVMMSREVEIWGHDQHVILNAQTKEVLNQKMSVTRIGNYCWLGARSTVLKNADIPDYTIVGACSVVTKPFTEQYTALGGNPAKVIKTNVMFGRESVNRYLQENKET